MKKLLLLALFVSITAVITAQMQVGTPSISTGTIKFAASGDANITTLQSGDAPASEVILKLPADDPAAGEALKVTSFAGGIAALEWGTSGGTPGGADTQVQFNDAGAFGGDADFVWNKTANTLTLGTNSEIRNAAGTSTDPSYSFSGATTAGIYYSSGTFLQNSSTDSLYVYAGGIDVRAASADIATFAAGGLTVKKSNLTVGTAFSDAGILTLKNATDADSWILKPNNPTASFTMLLPDDAPAAGEFLKITSYSAPTITTEWAAAAGGTTFDAIGDAAAAGTVNNAAYAQDWNWTNNAAATALDIKGQLTHASAKMVEIEETTASSGGSGAQYLLDVGTLATSTAIPLRVSSRGTEVFQVARDATAIRAANGSSTAPTYGFANLTTGGMWYDGTQTFFQYDATHYVYITSSAVTMYSGAALQVNANGVDAYKGGGAVLTMNSGNSTDTGIAYMRRVKADTTGQSLSTTVAAGSLVPGTVHCNVGAGGSVTYTMPAAVVGAHYTFVVRDAQSMIIDPAGTETIQVAASVSTATTGNVQANTIGNVITVTCVTTAGAPQWVATSIVGTWTVN